jgi:drug/metabolite transporter (DMT)-like permease
LRASTALARHEHALGSQTRCGTTVALASPTAAMQLSPPAAIPTSVPASAPRGDARIWFYAFGYFACYAPYSALTKLVSQGRFPGMSRVVDGFELLPLTTFVSLVAMLVFLTAKGWWSYAGRRVVLGRSVIAPGKWTFLSGLATAAIIASTTLAYTFRGVSIVFMMLLMRGGVLAIAPVVDAAGKRRVHGTSWLALGLSLLGLVITLQDGASYDLALAGMIDAGVYLAAYFVRLRLMSHVAKSGDRATSIRYFVEEQMVATPAIVAFLVLLALAGQGQVMLAIRAGFGALQGSGAVSAAVAIGVLSQGTGIFGALILLDGRENAFCVPVNRASSVLAGVLASAALAFAGLAHRLPASELVGATFVLGAIVVLALPRRTPT